MSGLPSSISMFSYCLAATSLQPEKKKKKRGMERQRSSQCGGSNGRAVMRCVSNAFSDCTVLAAAPVNHDYNGEERWEQWCRKSRSDNYNAWDKIMGTRCTLPIISCISCRLIHEMNTYYKSTHTALASVSNVHVTFKKH